MRRFVGHRSVVVLAGLVASANAWAQSTGFSGVFASDPAGCQALADEGRTPARRGDFVLLTGQGLLGYAYTCEFVSVQTRPSGRPGWVATAFCDAPGFSHPDLISIADAGRGNVALTFMSQVAGAPRPAAAGNGGGEIGVNEMGTADAAALGEAAAEEALRRRALRVPPFAPGGALARRPDDPAAGEIGPYEMTGAGGAGNIFYACPGLSEGNLR
ncbi:MAG: hypothetical protein U1E56_04770 [Bauldia sp.]